MIRRHLLASALPLLLEVCTPRPSAAVEPRPGFENHPTTDAASITFSPPSSSFAELTVGALPREERLTLNAGLQQLRVERTGHVSTSSIVTLVEWDAASVSLDSFSELERVDLAPAPLPPEPAPPLSPPPARTALWTNPVLRALKPCPVRPSPAARSRGGSNRAGRASLRSALPSSTYGETRRGLGVLLLAATGALTGASVTFGLLTRRANAALGDRLERYPAPRTSVEDGRDQVRTFALLTDTFGLAAATALGVSTYFFFSTGKLSDDPASTTGLRAQIGPRASSVTWVADF